MTLTCRSQWITMPGHTINKLLTPPDFLQHTPVPHVEKSSHAYRKTSDHLHAVQSVIDYSVRAQRFLTHIFFRILMEICPTFKMLDLFPESSIWRNTVVKLTTLTQKWHYHSSLQKTNQEQVFSVCTLQQPSALALWKSWCTGKLFSAVVKAIILENLYDWTISCTSIISILELHVMLGR